SDRWIPRDGDRLVELLQREQDLASVLTGLDPDVGQNARFEAWKRRAEAVAARSQIGCDRHTNRIGRYITYAACPRRVLGTGDLNFRIRNHRATRILDDDPEGCACRLRRQPDWGDGNQAGGDRGGERRRRSHDRVSLRTSWRRASG